MQSLSELNRELKSFIIFGKIYHSDILKAEKDIKNIGSVNLLKNLIEDDNRLVYFLKFLKLLFHQQEINLNILLEEIINSYSILEFFTPYNGQKKNFNKDSSCYRTLYGSFSYLKKNIKNVLSEKIWESISTIKEAKQNISKLEDLIVQISNNSIDYQIKLFKVLNSLEDFFRFYIIVNNTLLSLIQLADFLQKKIVSLLGGSPGYYPTPIGSSTREHPILHHFIENLANEILSLLESIFLEATPSNKASLFYWDFSETFHFMENVKSKLIFKSDPFFPSNQHFWIVLFHEAFHFLLFEKKKELERELLEGSLDYTDKTKNLLKTLHNRASYIVDEVQLISGADLYLGENSILDIFIDSLLSYILGIPYFIGLSLSTFAYDEKSFLFPIKNRIWYIRLMLSAFFALKHYELLRKIYSPIYKNFTETFGTILKLYKGLQLLRSNYPDKLRILYNFEETIAYLIGSHLLDIINLYNKDFKKCFSIVEKGDTFLTIYYNFVDNTWNKILINVEKY